MKKQSPRSSLPNPEYIKSHFSLSKAFSASAKINKVGILLTLALSVIPTTIVILSFKYPCLMNQD